MSIFGLFSSSAQQEEISNSYQDWRDNNPDNLSDDDFYDDDAEKVDTDQLFRDGYYDDIIAKWDEPASGDNSGGGFFGWLCR